jgi:integrase
VSIFVRPCKKCAAKERGDRKDRRGRKGCRECKWRAVTPPKLERKTLGVFDTKEKAESALRKALTDAENGIDLPRGNLTCAEVAERFFKAVVNDLEAITVERYSEHWHQHVEPVLGQIPVTRLKAAHLSDLYGKLRSGQPRYVKKVKNADGTIREKVRLGRPLGPNSVLRVHRFVHRLLGWALRNDLVARNVADAVQAPKGAPSPAKALSADQVAALLAAAEGKQAERKQAERKQLYPFLALAVTTGMRRGELGALTWDSVDFDRGVVTVRQAVGEDRFGHRFVKGTKSNRQRTVPLNTLAVAALRRHRANQAEEKMLHRDVYDDQDFVFANEVGAMLDLDSVSKAFSALATEVGIKVKGISLHSCRHFGATQALVAGNDLRTVAALLGHADASVTLRTYAHVVPGAQERAVAGIGDAIAAAQARRAASENSRS